MKEKLFKKIVLFLLTLLFILIIGIIVIIINVDYTNIKKYEDYGLETVNENLIEDVKTDYLNSNDNSIDNPYIKYAPLNHDLTAVIAFESDKNISNYDLVVEGKTQDTNLRFSNNIEKYKGVYVVEIAGLYINHDNKVDIEYTFENGEKVKYQYIISTPEDLNKEFKKVSSSKINYNIIEDAQFHSIMNNSIIMDSEYNGYDTNGDIRFAMESGTLSDDVSLNFEKIPYFTLQISDDKGQSTVYFLDRIGYIRYQFTVPDGKEIHHDMTIDNEGNIYVPIRPKIKIGKQIDGEWPYTGTEILKVSPDGIQQIYDFSYILDDKTTPIIANATPKDLHINTVDIDEEHNLGIISSRSTSEIYFIDLDSGEIKYVLGNYDNKSDLFNDKYFKPIGENYNNFSGQHSVYIVNDKIMNQTIPNDTLIVSLLDNNSCIDETGNNIYKTDLNESKDLEICSAPTNSISIYKLNLTNLTSENLMNIYADNVKDNDMFSGNVVFQSNYLTLSPTGSSLEVYDMDGKLLFTIPEENYSGRYRKTILNPGTIKKIEG